MSSQFASHEMRMPAAPTTRSRRVLEIALLAFVVVAYSARMFVDLVYLGTPLVAVLVSAISLAIGMFLYKAGKRSGFSSQAAGREMPSSATENVRRRRTVDFALIAVIATVFLARPIETIVEGSAHIVELIWPAFFFAVGRILYVAGKRSVQSGHRRIDSATKILGSTRRIAPWLDVALVGFVVVFSTLSIWHTATSLP